MKGNLILQDGNGEKSTISGRPAFLCGASGLEIPDSTQLHRHLSFYLLSTPQECQERNGLDSLGGGTEEGCDESVRAGCFANIRAQRLVDKLILL